MMVVSVPYWKEWTVLTDQGEDVGGEGSKKKEKPLYKYVDRTVDHELEQRMDQVEGDLEDMYKKRSVGHRSTPDNPRHPSTSTRQPAGGMGTGPMSEPTTSMQCLTWGKLTRDPVNARQEQRGRLGKKTKWNPCRHVWGKDAET
ncbi:hypothetical protein CHU98_g8361 [Xylaria longipes]|nr:hypothetical protein CHU98_g8361 [Xylaria longipes]